MKHLSADCIKQGCKVIANGSEYSALAKVLYVSAQTGRQYWKIFLSDGYLLGYYLSDLSKPAFFGKLVYDLPSDFDSLPDEILYDGRVYKKDGGEEYERVLRVEFGDLEHAEGECRFTNYSAEDGSWLSPGLVSQTARRADFYGEDIGEYEIRII